MRILSFGISKKLFVLFFDFLEIRNETFVEALAFLGNIWLLGCALLFHFCKVVRAINPPSVKETDFDSIGGAEERASHAHITVVMELNFSVLLVDIIVGTILNAESAF